jgi:hypothetical protein
MLQIAADLRLGVGQEQKGHECFSFRSGSDMFEGEQRIFAHKWRDPRPRYGSTTMAQALVAPNPKPH